MAKFAQARTYPTSPITTTATGTTTHAGGSAWERDHKSDLFLLACVNMVGETTFYEAAGERDERFRHLVHEVTRLDPDWVARFVPYLRTQLNMRSAAVVMAAESAIARTHGCAQPPTIPVRTLIASALARPDEPGEFIAYWKSRHGGKTTLPGGVQRGVADAVTRLYTERAALKYDGVGNRWRMADVIACAKPTPGAAWQADLFDYLADRRWKREQARVTDRLPMITAYQNAKALPEAQRRAFFLADPARLGAAGMTWEELSSLGPMDGAAWTAIIPHMGLMALTRNLRNFDEAGVPDQVAATVAARLADPEQVRASRQFPYRFYSAYKAAPSPRWGHALEQALAASVSNIPELPGRTLVLVDTSGSMQQPVSQRSTVRHVDVGALFAVALAARGCEVDLHGFANGVFSHALTPGGSVLRQCEAFTRRIGEVGHGTQTAAALRASFAGHDRVVIFTDGQAFADWGYSSYPRAYGQPPGASSVSEAIPANIPLFGVNTVGYAKSSLDTAQPNRFEIGGFSDKLFTLMDLLVRGRAATWPF